MWCSSVFIFLPYLFLLKQLSSLYFQNTAPSWNCSCAPALLLSVLVHSSSWYGPLGSALPSELFPSYPGALGNPTHSAEFRYHLYCQHLATLYSSQDIFSECHTHASNHLLITHSLVATWYLKRVQYETPDIPLENYFTGNPPSQLRAIVVQDKTFGTIFNSFLSLISHIQTSYNNWLLHQNVSKICPLLLTATAVSLFHGPLIFYLDYTEVSELLFLLLPLASKVHLSKQQPEWSF